MKISTAADLGGYLLPVRPSAVTLNRWERNKNSMKVSLRLQPLSMPAGQPACRSTNQPTSHPNELSIGNRREFESRSRGRLEHLLPASGKQSAVLPFFLFVSFLASSLSFLPSHPTIFDCLIRKRRCCCSPHRGPSHSIHIVPFSRPSTLSVFIFLRFSLPPSKLGRNSGVSPDTGDGGGDHHYLLLFFSREQH